MKWINIEQIRRETWHLWTAGMWNIAIYNQIFRMETFSNNTQSITESPLKYQRSNTMKKTNKQNSETIVLENSKTGETRQSTAQNTSGKQTKNSLSCFQRFQRQKVRYWHISCKRRSPQKMNLLEPVRPLPESWTAMLQQFGVLLKRWPKKICWQRPIMSGFGCSIRDFW